MTFELITITPEMASEMLVKNTFNRPLDKGRISDYANLMKAGRWFGETGETIKFSNGTLIDGQNRLTAVIKAGIPVVFGVMKEVPKEAVRYLDQGKKRSNADALAMLDIPNFKEASALINLYLTVKAKQNETNRPRLSNDEVIEEYNKRPEFWQDLIETGKYFHKESESLMPVSWIAAWYGIFAEVNPEKVDAFFSSIFIARNSFPTSDIFYKVLTEIKGNKAKRMTLTYKNALFIKTWKSYLNNKPLKHLRFDSFREDYPSLSNDDNENGNGNGE